MWCHAYKSQCFGGWGQEDHEFEDNPGYSVDQKRTIKITETECPHVHLPDQYFALCLEMKDEFGIAQRGPVCRARHIPSLGCGEENLSGRS